MVIRRSKVSGVDTGELPVQDSKGLFLLNSRYTIRRYRPATGFVTDSDVFDGSLLQSWKLFERRTVQLQFDPFGEARNE